MAVMLVCLFVCMLQSEKEREREWGGGTRIPSSPALIEKKDLNKDEDICLNLQNV